MDEYEINVKVKVVAASATAAEEFVETSLSHESSINPALEVVSVKTDLDSIGRPEERTYCVGLPVVATVREDGFVTVEVDLSELGTSVRKDEFPSGDENISDEQIEADADLLDRWSDVHTVKNDGYDSRQF